MPSALFIYACVLKSFSYKSCVSFVTYTTRIKQDISLNISNIKCTVRHEEEHINTVFIKPRLVINVGKIYQNYVLSYKCPGNFLHLLVWMEDGKYNCRYVLTCKTEKAKLVLYYILLQTFVIRYKVVLEQ
jgi:hypothetical protein